MYVLQQDWESHLQSSKTSGEYRDEYRIIQQDYSTWTQRGVKKGGSDFGL